MSWISLQLDRFNRLCWYLLALVVRQFTRVKDNQVFMWSYGMNQYACNPRYLSEYILQKEPNDWEIIWAFAKGVDISSVDERIRIVNYPSVSYLVALYSSKFVVTNLRNDRFGTFFKKKSNQKYLMLWHGSTPLKRIEKDAEIELGPLYDKRAKDDSRMCDLMISNCDFYTSIIKRAFWYGGEILECGLPRNSVFFDGEYRTRSKKDVYNYRPINQSSKIILYAPTFRNNNDSLDPYNINWAKVIPCLEDAFNCCVTIILRLHPNMIGRDVSELINHPCVFDYTSYPDMQSLLCAAHVLITDYSSTMFDASIIGIPCFLYATDVGAYDRGFYFRLGELPYSLSQNNQELCDNILSFNKIDYTAKVNEFMGKQIGMKEDGKGSKAILAWMKSHLASV